MAFFAYRKHLEVPDPFDGSERGQEHCLKRQELQLESSGSKGPLWIPARTIEWSQEGTSGDLEGFILLAPFRNLTMRSCFPRDRPSTASWWAAIVATYTFKVEGDSLCIWRFHRSGRGCHMVPSPWERMSFLRGIRQGGAVAREMSSGNQVRVGQWGANSRSCSSSCATRLTGGNEYLRKARGQLCASASVLRGPSVREKYSWQWELLSSSAPQLQAVDVPKQSGPCPEPRGCLPVACSAPARAGGICCDNSMPGHLF